MTPRIYLNPVFLVFWLICFLPTDSCLGAPIVSNVSPSQRTGTKLMDITYDVSAPGATTVIVTLEVSDDGGATFLVPVIRVSGAVGMRVTPGAGRTLTWDAGVDWPRKFSSQMRFRIKADDRPPLEQFLSWDLSAQTASFGVLMVDAAGRFAMSELVEQLPDGAKRRNAGLHFVDYASGKYFMLLVDAAGFPTQLTYDSGTFIQFSNADPVSNLVTVRLFDVQGAALSEPVTAAAPAGYFALATTGFTALRASATKAVASQEISSPSPAPPVSEAPTIWDQLMTVGKAAALDFINTVGAYGGSPLNTYATMAGVMTTPFTVSKEMGNDPGKIVNGTVYFVNSSQCGIFLGELALGPGTGGATLAVAAASATSGTIACYETVKPAIEAVYARAAYIERKAWVAELIRLGRDRVSSAGQPYSTDPGGSLYYFINRRDEYFELILAASTLYGLALSEIFQLSVADQPSASDNLFRSLESLIKKLDDDEASAQSWVTTEQGTEDARQRVLPAYDSSCATGNEQACSLAAQIRAASPIYLKNIATLNGIVATLKKMRSNITGF